MFFGAVFCICVLVIEGVTSDYEEILWLRFERQKEGAGHGGEGASEQCGILRDIVPSRLFFYMGVAPGFFFRGITPTGVAPGFFHGLYPQG